MNHTCLYSPQLQSITAVWLVGLLILPCHGG